MRNLIKIQMGQAHLKLAIVVLAHAWRRANIKPVLLSLFLCVLSSAQTAIANNHLAQAKSVTPVPLGQALSLRKAIEIAQENDDWLVKSRLLEQGLMALSQGARALPDPTFSVSMLNLPTDSFAFNQEPMTQFSVGASQMFPRGDTLALQQKQFQTKAAEQPFQRINRRQQVALQVSMLWLDAYKASISYSLIKQSEPLFDKLSEIVSASYVSTKGPTNQQDVMRAQLELVRLQDRLVSLETDKRVAISKLSQYLFAQSFSNKAYAHGFVEMQLPNALATLTPHNQQVLSVLENASNQDLFAMLAKHPSISAIEQRIIASNIDVDIAKQAYKPQYGVNTSYAVRNDAPADMGGGNRADFFSVGVNVSFPLFSKARQGALVSNNTKMAEALETEKRLSLKELLAGVKGAYEQFDGAYKRADIYKSQILPQLLQLANAELSAYTNDTGNFVDVVSARIAALDAKVTLVNIDVQQRKALAYIQYYLLNADAETDMLIQSNSKLQSTQQE